MLLGFQLYLWMSLTPRGPHGQTWFFALFLFNPHTLSQTQIVIYKHNGVGLARLYLLARNKSHVAVICYYLPIKTW